MGITALSVLEQRLAEEIGDWIEVEVTTDINADTSIVSTNLNSYDGGSDDYFNDWWVYVTDYANAGVQRQVSDYAQSSGTLTVRGGVLADDGGNTATIRLHRYNRDQYIVAFNNTVRDLSNNLFQEFDVSELVTGNVLPNSHFRDWTVSSYPDKYALVNATATANTAGANVVGGGKSAKVIASASNGYMYITSDTCPALRNLMGQTVSLYCWAVPQIANDATMVIYTVQADGTTQTLTSTTANPAGANHGFTLLKLENQRLNDNLSEVQIRFKVATNSRYVFFDHARLMGVNQTDYLLPIDFRDGSLDTVSIQTDGLSDQACDDPSPRSWEELHGWDIKLDGSTDKYLHLPFLYPTDRLLRLRGKKSLSTVSAYTDTIEINNEHIDAFIAYAEYRLFDQMDIPASSADVSRYEMASAKAYAKYTLLRQKLTIPRRSPTLNIGGVYSR